MAYTIYYICIYLFVCVWVCVATVYNIMYRQWDYTAATATRVCRGVGPRKGRTAAPFTRRARNLVISPARLHIIIIRIRIYIITSAYGYRAISIQSPINRCGFLCVCVYTYILYIIFYCT